MLVTETGLHTMIGEAAKSIQESGGKHVGVFEGKIIMAGRVLIILTLVAVGSLLLYQVVRRARPPPQRLTLALALTLALGLTPRGGHTIPLPGPRPPSLPP